MIFTDEIKQNLKTGFIGKRIFCYEVLDSTNLEARRLINNSEARHGDLIIAEKQYSGKGQTNNIWDSPTGGLYLSIITVSKVCSSSNLLSLASGVSCVKAINSVTGISANLKWVNDILANKQKIGGILAESITSGNISTNITGIGINVNSKILKAENCKFKPVSLIELTGKKVDVNLLISEICNYYEKYFDLYQTDSDKIIAEWLNYANINSLKVNFVANERALTGIATGINKFGHLIVNTGENEYTLSSTKDIELIYS